MGHSRAKLKLQMPFSKRRFDAQANEIDALLYDLLMLPWLGITSSSQSRRGRVNLKRNGWKVRCPLKQAAKKKSLTAEQNPNGNLASIFRRCYLSYISRSMARGRKLTVSKAGMDTQGQTIFNQLEKEPKSLSFQWNFEFSRQKYNVSRVSNKRT